jgi:hypothetical protein
MFAEVGDDVAGADFARRRRERGAGRLWLILRTVGHD